jgi:hypothetical protein
MPRFQYQRWISLSDTGILTSGARKDSSGSLLTQAEDNTMNDMPHVQNVCSDISAAIANVRACLRSAVKRDEILDRFWGLQDCLHRVVASVSDEGPKALELVRERCPHLAVSILDVLVSADEVYIGRIPAVADACHAINQFVNELNQLEHSEGMVASAQRV